jgi:recombinational DNA repair protein RecT
MVVGIVAQSNEVESNKLKLDISWDGIWSEDPDEMVKHMVIKPLPSVNP